MPLVKNTESKISEKDYLEGELISEIKHEYIAGSVYAMSGASDNHNRISQNISRELGNEFRKQKSSCDVFSSDIKVRISKEGLKYFYPDVMVVCDKHEDDDSYYKHSPVIIVEILSKSTKKYDLTTKKMYYFNIPALEEYVVIEQDICRIEVYRRSEDWKSTSYFLDDEIHFESIDITISVEDIYYHVDNNETVDFFNKKKQESDQ